MPFYDLSIAYTPDHGALSNILLFAKELGYDTVALCISVAGKLPLSPPVVPISSIVKPDKLNILTRLNLTISDTTQNHRLSSLATSYDLIALRPTNEKALQQCCSSLECDLISLDFSQRLLFPLKFKMIASAFQRGIRFEICYSPGVVAGNDARRNLISGATQLIRAARGRGIIISSEAKSALGLRAPWDVMNLAQVWGLSQERAKEALCEEAGKIVRFAGIKRTSFRGVVDIIDSGLQTAEDTKVRSLATASTTQTQPSSNKVTEPDTTEQDEVSTINGVKRKASGLSLIHSSAAETSGDKPLSKGQAKRRAKKAKLEARTISNSNTAMANAPKSLPIQHETLKSNEPK